VLNWKPSTALPVALLFTLALTPAFSAPAAEDDDDEKPGVITEIVVTASRLDIARAKLEPSLGASTYTLSNEAVESRPGSETVSIGQILLQAPGVSQDGSGQIRVRSQGDLQYRINNVVLPEGFTDLGESLSARLADKVQLVTGALPAQYGLHVGGIVNITTKSGAYQDGGQAELYGGSHGEFEPAFEYAGSSGATNFFFSGSYLGSDIGLNAPNGSANPRHDRTDQFEGFAYLDHIIDDQTRISLIMGTSEERFELPYQSASEALSTAPAGSLFRPPLIVAGFDAAPDTPLSGSQQQNTHYGIASYLRTTETLTLQASAFARHSSLKLDPDTLIDLRSTGLSQSVANSDFAAGLQFEAAYQLSAEHMIRAGLVANFDTETNRIHSFALPVDAQGWQTSQSPASISDRSRERIMATSLFLQDEWRPFEPLTVNFGLRFDHVDATDGGNAVSPRINLVWATGSGTTLHAGYARYFIPAPRSEIGDTAASLTGTTGAAPTVRGDPLRPETDDYFDIGIQQTLSGLTAGLDGYWREARDLIDEILVGPGALRDTFNFRTGRVRGIELSLTYAHGPFSAWSNVALSEAEGRGIVSNQFGFTPAELAYADGRFVRLAHDQTFSVSGGASYRFGAFRLSSDLIYGSGLRRTQHAGAANDAGLPGYLQVNLAAVYHMDGLGREPIDLRIDIINAFDRRYEIRDGTALGGGVPQWGARRGIFAGIEQSF
jgi:outer membrane cobalamin receptor